MPAADPKTDGRSTLRAASGPTTGLEAGLRLPIVYNTSGYDSLDSLRLMEGIVDIYMPDLKIWAPGRARRYRRMPGYPQAARQAATQMHRQVGPLHLGQDGLARRGLLVRHLMMPGMPVETGAILRYVTADLGTDTYANLMAQYHPAGLAGSTHRDSYHEIARQLARHEYELAIEYADLGLRRLDQRSRAAALQLPMTLARRAACQPPARTPGSGRQRLERHGGWLGRCRASVHHRPRGRR